MERKIRNWLFNLRLWFYKFLKGGVVYTGKGKSLSQAYDEVRKGGYIFVLPPKIRAHRYLRAVKHWERARKAKLAGRRAYALLVKEKTLFA